MSASCQKLTRTAAKSKLFYPITLSAVESSVGGTWPSHVRGFEIDLEVGCCCTGKSAGFSFLRMRAT